MPRPCRITALILLLTAVFSGCRPKDDDGPVPDPANPNELFFVFVDQAGGSPTGDGTRQSPLNGIPAGIAQAASAGKRLCVAEGDYAVDSSAGTALVMNGSVSLYGGYRNTGGAWTRDPALYVTSITDTATVGGVAAVECGYGAGAGAPGIDGFTLRSAAAGSGGACIRITNDSSVTLSDCDLVIRAAATASAVLSANSIVRATGTITLDRCSITGGGGSSVEAILVYRYNLILRQTTISGLTSTGRCWAVDCGYGAFTVDGCDIDAGTSSSPAGQSCGLYINECFPYTVTNSTIRGGNGQAVSHAFDIMDTELIGGPCTIQGNTIDGGGGAISYCIELESAQIYPSIIGNTFLGSGTATRYGLYERNGTNDPVAVVNNVFNAGLGDAANRYFYRDYSSGAEHLINDITALNAIDEPPQNYNPAGSVSGNSVAP